METGSPSIIERMEGVAPPAVMASALDENEFPEEERQGKIPPSWETAVILSPENTFTPLFLIRF